MQLSHPHLNLVIEVPDDALKAHLAQGWLQVVDIDPVPSKSATKDVWVDYAESTGMDDAEEHTKQDLVDRYS